MSLLSSWRRPAVAAPLVVVLALAAAACGGSSGSGGTTSSSDNTNGKVPEGNVAVVDGQGITKGQLAALMSTAEKNFKKNNQKFPKVGTNDYERLKQQAVQQLVQQTDLEVGARQLGVKVTAADVDKKLAQLQKAYFPSKKKGQAFDVAKYQKALKDQGLTEAELKKNIAEQLREQKVYDKVTSTVKVTDADIQKYYNQNKKTLYTTPESRHVRHILVNKKALADQLYKQLGKHGDKEFAKLAKKYSKDPGSAVKGGDLGDITKNQTVPPFDKVAFNIQQGIVSRPVKTQFGYHLIEAVGPIKPAHARALDKALKTQIRQQLDQTKKQKAFFDWYQKLKKGLDQKTKYAAGYEPPATTSTATATGTTTG